MKNEKAIGHDGIPIEAWKAIGTQAVLLHTERTIRSLLLVLMGKHHYIQPMTNSGSVQE